MEQKLSGILWDVMILAGFVYLFLVMKGIVKTAQPVKTIQQPSFFIKLLIYGGLLLFTTLIVLEIISK